MNSNDSQIIMYQTEDGKTKIDVRMEDETVWLNQNQMAELFQRGRLFAEYVLEITWFFRYNILQRYPFSKGVELI